MSATNRLEPRRGVEHRLGRERPRVGALRPRCAPRRWAARVARCWPRMLVALVLLGVGLAAVGVWGAHPALSAVSALGAGGAGTRGGGGIRLAADTVLAQGGQNGQGGGDPTQQIMGIVDRARTWLMWTLTAVVALIIVFAGLRYAFAGGRVEEIEAAKRTLKSAVTGYLLAVLADALVALLRNVAGA